MIRSLSPSMGIPSKNETFFPLCFLSRKTFRGFTLIEILLVLIFLGMIAALAVPQFHQSFRDLSLQTASNDLQYLMRYAQGRAMTRGGLVRLVFDSGAKTYWLEEKTSQEESEETEVQGLPDEEFHRIAGRFKRTFHLPEDLTWETPLSEIKFYLDGTMDKARVRLCQQGRCEIISTAEQRGRVHVFGEGEE